VSNTRLKVLPLEQAAEELATENGFREARMQFGPARDRRLGHVERLLPPCRPASVFVFLSLAFGLIIIFSNPPLRGPDEIAHFLRIYSYARGELLPVSEIKARKGIFVSPELYNQLYFFKTAGEVFARASEEQGMRYGRIMAEYSKLPDPGGDETEQASMFAPFAGTEGYNPVAYIPYIVATAIGRLLRLDFPAMLLLMRCFGLLAFTAVAAYAIAATPVLKWAFLLIAMLPVSLYNRTVLSADGAALSYTLAISALCFRAARKPAAGRTWERSLWMTLCALSKQPQIVFVLLELMVCRLKESRRWGSLAIVVLPGLLLSPLWVGAVSADIAVWRLLEERTDSSEQFDPLWKLLYMWDHPYHFPLAAWTAVSGWAGRLWQELIGIVGWQDILLPPWTYLVLTVLLLLVPLQKLKLDAAVRTRVAVITGLVVLGYIILVYLIFFLIYTPIDTDHVRGVQGRYFVIALPAAAIFIAAVVNRELPRGMPAVIAVAGSMIAGITTVEAILRAHW
jgi:uncharacterized membrane protein